MADQTETKIVEAVSTVAGIYTATVSTNDTVTLGNFKSINASAVFKLSDWTEVSHSKSGNVITITEAGLSNTPIMMLVAGL